MLYADVTSVTYGNSTFAYPLGHLVIHEDSDVPGKYFGVLRAVVRLPRGLYCPVLPHKTSKSKLVFPLCCTCAENNNQQANCEHSQEARAFTGVWDKEDFNRSLQLGYRVGEIIEVWHFENQSKSVFP